MAPALKPHPQADEQTLDLLPVAVILFDGKKIFFLNKKAIEIFSVPKQKQKKKEEINIYQLLDKEYHKQFKSNANKVLKGTSVDYLVLKIKNFKNKTIFIEVNSNPVFFKNKKMMQLAFFEITEQKEIENQNANYRNLLDGSPVAYIIHEHGTAVYANKSLLKMFKLKSKHQIIGKKIFDFFHKSEIKKSEDEIEKAYTNKKSKYTTTYLLHDAKENDIEVEIKSAFIKFDNRDSILSLVTNLSDLRQREDTIIKAKLTEISNKHLQKEIKEKQDIEKRLIERTAQMLSIFESSSHLIWTVNRKLQVTSFNKNFHNVLQIQHDISIKSGYKIDEHLLKNRDEYVNFWYTKYAEAFEGKKLEFEKEDINYGKHVYRKIFINPIYNKEGEITDISCIAHDITESKIYEQKLLNQTAKITAIFDSSNHYIWTVNRQGQLTSFNKNYFDLTENIFDVKPYLGLNIKELLNGKDFGEIMVRYYENAFSGESTGFEIEVADKNKKKIFLELFLNPIYENDKVVEISSIAHNITEKKQAQQRIEISLKEKEVLLKEVHHRVKNNMQVISSILNLQSSYVSDEYTLMLLKESQNRIKTMAYIHESLYQNKSFTAVNFYDYVHTLVNNIIQSYAYSEEKIKLELNAEKIMLSLDNSIPAGLIINELITNAIKHAFPGNKQGTIILNLKCENNIVFLELKDDGVGFAENVSFENSHSLGLQLVNTLIEQLEGQLKVETEKNKGTKVLIIFKM